MKHTSHTFPITGWKWIFYIYGWFTGALSLLFWAIMVIMYLVKHEKHFFSPQFHNRVFIWGVAMAIFSVLMVLLMLFLILVVTPVAMYQG